MYPTCPNAKTANANVENTTSNYIKVNENVLSTHEIANQLKVLIYSPYVSVCAGYAYSCVSVLPYI